ncbi:SDR family NAD(P)-dependent oxidoreductase [Hyphomicrobium sulfonivorans]|uniref:SDR family NAD(P)-dependent oxidoreductase n=1 Tax=Hyphomicrobium sulfonivorans TaxID=121290 RepID=UPI00156DAB76|nr:SDR family oxidoreductase [Hyphomicrobium sulfonivorans]MBI1651367.1 SDR family oxidoreductase [Hyphomicrobium sulfonivorans]NSL73310.1 short-chain dehydrogenase [Hyphomicrobium sulfonivorans]
MTRDTFTGKRALITGASSGIGVEFAELLAAQKVNLVLAARRREPMEALAADLRRKHGVDVVVEAIDLAAPGAAARLKSSLDERSISIDILINNAGYGLQGDFLETPIERTVDMIQLNVTALTELSYLFGRDMAERGSGHILLVASLLAFQAVPTFAAYAATKAYVLNFGEALHDEVRSRGVVVTTLCPGHTATGFDAAAGATVSPLLRLLTMKARPVAASGIKGLAQGKASIIAGLSNKMAAFSNRLTPRSMQRATMRKIAGA